MLLRQLFDYETWTYTYLLADEESREAVLIDPVIDQIERDIKLLDERMPTTSRARGSCASVWAARRSSAPPRVPRVRTSW